MKYGVLVMLDALGFKGIWRRPPSDASVVLAKLRGLQEAMEQTRLDAADLVNIHGLEVHAACLSDTIVAGVSCANREEIGWCLFAAAYVASRACELAAADEPRLALRGTFCIGEFAMDRSFIVGPAVDEAAELMNLADGAFVWLSPAALRVCEKYASFFQGLLFEHPVPLKGRSAYRTRVVMPFGDAVPHRYDEIASRILSTFDAKNIDVDIKEQNTRAFLEAVKRETERFAKDAELAKSQPTG